MTNKLDKIIELLEWQNELLQGLVLSQVEANEAQMQALDKLLGDGGPSVHEESMEAMERMRTGALRDALAEDTG